MKILLRKSHNGRSGYAALMLFLVAYTATMALVIAPEQIKSAMDAPWAWASK